jgi:hypothetical protein
LQKTLPLNAVARSVEDYLRNQGGVLPQQQAAPAAPHPSRRRACGRMFARAALDTAIEPTAGTASQWVLPPNGSAAASDAHRATPYPIGSGPAVTTTPPPRKRRQGAGVFGYVMVLLSRQQVGVGFALYRFAPF